MEKSPKAKAAVFLDSLGVAPQQSSDADQKKAAQKRQEVQPVTTQRPATSWFSRGRRGTQGSPHHEAQVRLVQTVAHPLFYHDVYIQSVFVAGDENKAPGSYQVSVRPSSDVSTFTRNQGA